MNPALASEIVKYLSVSAPPKEGFRRLAISPRQWRRTLEWLDHSGITLLLWSRLKAQGEDSVIPPEVGKNLDQNLADHRLRVAQMIAEFASINRCFEASSLKYAALKGLTLTSAYCPDILLRTTYDYDYLLPRKSMETAENALRAAGYIQKEDPEEHPIVYFHKAHPPRSPFSRDDLYSPAFPRTIELHYLFWDAESLRIPLNFPVDPLAHLELRCLQTCLDDEGPLGSGRSVYFYTLSETDELIFQVLHAFRHILQDWCRLCSLLDIAYFLAHRTSDCSFWDQFLGRLEPSPELAEIVGVVFLLAEGLFGAEVPDGVARRTTRGLRRSLVSWVERYGKSSALQNFSDNKFSLFLHHEFLRDDATWRAVQRSRLFPIHRPNQAVQGTGVSLRSRASAAWKQAGYVMRRLKHHLKAAARYKLESYHWEHVRSRTG